ncbi:cAMP-regulated phosphoprotein 19-related protein isoform X1 [Wolffia australiana]
MEKRGEDLTATISRESTASEDLEASIDMKYGGILPKKKPLISQSHARAFFDSADWVLYQGEDRRAAMETLRPKLQVFSNGLLFWAYWCTSGLSVFQPTPHQRLAPRRPKCRSMKDDKGE